MNWRCCFIGHVDGAPFTEEGRLTVRCMDCGRVSPGAAPSDTRPELRYEGDPRRHQLTLRHLVRLHQWKQTHDTRRRA